MLEVSEVAKHCTQDSCWVIIKDQAYDLTNFLDDHPGGASIILRCAGKDVTNQYEPLHPPGTIERYLSTDQCRGPVKSLMSGGELQRRPSEPSESIPLALCMNLDDFERAAKLEMDTRPFAYYHSAAEDLLTVRRNREDWSKVRLRPRTMVDVRTISTRRRIMGHDSSTPFFIAPAAMARLAHPDAEYGLLRGAIKHNVPYVVSTYSSISHPELAGYQHEHANGFRLLRLQLYVNKDKEKTRQVIKTGRENGFKSLLVTVDTAVGGKREEDELLQAKIAYESGQNAPPRQTYSQGEMAPILRGAHSSTLNWRDLDWMLEEWQNTGPVYLKGIQCAEDAHRALRAKVTGIYLSNHGGRQLDSGSSSLMVLLEIRRFCPEVLESMEVYLDGGIHRGTDVIKAICLGVTAVGLGRPFIYALGVFGSNGVIAAMQILRDEIEGAMRLMGVTDLAELDEDHVNTTSLERLLPRRLKYFAARSRL